MNEKSDPDTQAPAIDYFSTSHPLRRLTTQVAYRARKRMFDFFLQTTPITPQMRVLDVGVTPDRSLSDSNFFERFYPYKNQITATSIEDAAFLEKEYPGLRFISTDGETLPFEDGAFDVVVSFAVLEHVGNREQQQRFIAEATRVGRRFFLTTPNRQFPIEVHTFLPFLHWLPQPTHQAILRRLGLDFWSQTANLNLLTPAELLKLFPSECEVQLHKHHLLGLPSNLVVYGRSAKDANQS